MNGNEENLKSDIGGHRSDVTETQKPTVNEADDVVVKSCLKFGYKVDRDREEEIKAREEEKKKTAEKLSRSPSPPVQLQH